MRLDPSSKFRKTRQRFTARETKEIAQAPRTLRHIPFVEMFEPPGIIVGGESFRLEVVRIGRADNFLRRNLQELSWRGLDSFEGKVLINLHLLLRIAPELAPERALRLFIGILQKALPRPVFIRLESLHALTSSQHHIADLRFIVRMQWCLQPREWEGRRI